jgi:hypothetical protein
MPLYPLINVLIALVIVGVILWGVSQIPMDETIRKVIRVIVVVVVVIWLVYFLVGFLPSSLPSYRR